MINRNVARALQEQKVAFTPEDEKTIKEEGVKPWLKKEFGVQDKEAIESAYAGITEASPEIAEMEKKVPAAEGKAEDKAKDKTWWSDKKTEP